MYEEMADELYEKVKANEIALHKQWLEKSKKELVNEICNLAYRQNFADALIYYCENFDPDDGMTLSVKTVSYLLNYNGNMIEFLADTAQNIRHFERYNLNDWDEELPALIESCIDYVKVKEEQKNGEMF